MSGELITALLTSGLATAIAAPLGAWLGGKLERRKYLISIEALRAQLDENISTIKSSELDNVRKANDILVESIVQPLKKEIKYLRSDVNKFRKAVEQIPSCPMADSCPVSRELQKQEAADEDGDAHGGKA